VPVLVFSSCEEGMFAERVLRAGGKGYLMKSEPAAKLLEAIRRVLSGKLFVSENVSARVLESFVGLERVSRHPLQQLSEREFEVLQHVGQGRSSRAIAELLRISPKTVEVHRSHIKRKLQLKSGAALMRFALRSIPGGPE
jgi:DNA-binding NarL/FixJ family response regulator